MKNGGHQAAESKQPNNTILVNEDQLDLGQVVDRVINRFGRYQKCIVFFLCFNSVIVAINHTGTAFHAYTPANFTCAETSLENYEPFTCVRGCKDYYYLDNETSAATEWDLVCDKRYLSAMINTVYFAGVTIGSFACGILADLWGRRKLVLLCLYTQGIFGVALYFSTGLEAFMILRFIQGFFVQGLQGSSYTLMQELTPARHLTLSGLTWEMLWVMGMVYLGSTSYFITDWRLHQLILIIPTIATLAWFWLIPESPSWNLTNDRKRETLQCAVTIAKRNHDYAFFDECNKMKMSSAGDGESRKPQEESAKMMDLFRNKILMKHIIVMIIVWYSCTVAYYGILLYTPSLPGGRHINFLGGSVIEVGAVILSYFALSSHLGRRFSMVFYQFLNAIFCFALGALVLVPSKGEWATYTTAMIALLGKGIAVSGIGGMHIYGAELFPTLLRGSAIGILGLSARIGSLTASQIILLGEVTHPAVSMMIMGALLLVGGIATFSVPETLNRKLPDTLNDVDETWGPACQITKEGATNSNFVKD